RGCAHVFFFQAEDGIRERNVTGVQTCALPISFRRFPERQRAIVHDELQEIVEKYGDERRTQIVAATGDVTDEDLIARENVVVTRSEERRVGKECREGAWRGQ